MMLMTYKWISRVHYLEREQDIQNRFAIVVNYLRAKSTDVCTSQSYTVLIEFCWQSENVRRTKKNTFFFFDQWLTSQSKMDRKELCWDFELLQTPVQEMLIIFRLKLDYIVEWLKRKWSFIDGMLIERKWNLSELIKSPFSYK